MSSNSGLPAPPPAPAPAPAPPDAEPAARGAVHVEPGERRRVLGDELRTHRVLQGLKQVAHLVGRGAVPVHGPGGGGGGAGGRLFPQHDRIRRLHDRDRVAIGLDERRHGERTRDRVRAAREERAPAPEEQQDGGTDGDQFEMLRAHAAPVAASGRYVRRVARRRRASQSTPATITSAGTPTMSPHFAAFWVAALVYTTWGGARFLDRIAINASSCASRSLAKSLLATTTTRPRGTPCAVSRGAGFTSSPTSRLFKLSRPNSRVGSRKAVVCCTPPARLVTKRGVTVPGVARVVSTWLAHGSSNRFSSAFTG